MSKSDKTIVRAAMRWNAAYLRYIHYLTHFTTVNSTIDDGPDRVQTFQKAQLTLSTHCCARLVKRKPKRKP